MATKPSRFTMAATAHMNIANIIVASLCRSTLFILCFGSLMFSEYGYAQERRIHVIELKSSLAQPVLEVIRPHLPVGAGASAVDNKLLLNVTDAELAQLQGVLEALDKAPESLMVFVKIYRGSYAAQRRQWWQMNASNAGVSARGGVQYQTEDSLQKTQQQVRALSGQAAFINVGEQIPYLTFRAPHYRGIAVDTQFLSAGTGFYVLPRVQGDQVTALINPEQIIHKNGQLQTAVMQTEIRGDLNEWMVIGGVTSAEQQSGNSYRTGSDDWLVELKIEKSR